MSKKLITNSEIIRQNIEQIKRVALFNRNHIMEHSDNLNVSNLCQYIYGTTEIRCAIGLLLDSERPELINEYNTKYISKLVHSLEQTSFKDLTFAKTIQYIHDSLMRMFSNLTVDVDALLFVTKKFACFDNHKTKGTESFLAVLFKMRQFPPLKPKDFWVEFLWELKKKFNVKLASEKKL